VALDRRRLSRRDDAAQVRQRAPTPREAATRPQVAACLAAAGLLLVYVAPIRNFELGSRRRQSVRLRDRDRRELEAVAAMCGTFGAGRSCRHAADDAFMAERVELIPYPEIAARLAN